MLRILSTCKIKLHSAFKFKCFSSFGTPWQILGIEMNSSKEEIDKSYRKLLLSVHPDHGGTTEDFLRVRQAREVLVTQLDSSYEINTHGGGLRKKSFENRFNEAIKKSDLDEAWDLWSLVLANQLQEPLTLRMCEIYLELLTQTTIKNEADIFVGEDRKVGVEGVVEQRWGGLLSAMDAFYLLRENNQFQQVGLEEGAWNTLLWHLAQLPRNELGGSNIMNDILLVCKTMDSLGIQQDLELLRTQIFTGRT